MSTIAEEEKKDQKCSRCKCYAYPKDFINPTGRVLKSCQKCRDYSKKCREKNKCEHGRRRNQCKECGGSSICEHNRRRSSCKDCKGISICEHNRIRNSCKDCGGVSICEHNRERNKCKICSDPIKVTISNWISSSRQKDKKRDRYDADHFIDKCFLKGLVEDYHNCYYCTIPLQYIKYEDDMATIERIDNKLGHIKSNCVLACRRCNYSCIGDSR